MGLLNLGKATANNITGTYTPNFLLVGMIEIKQGAGDLHIAPAQNVGDTNIFVIKIWQPAANGVRAITWDETYMGPGMDNFYSGGDPKDGDYAAWCVMCMQDDGASHLIFRFYSNSW